MGGPQRREGPAAGRMNSTCILEEDEKSPKGSRWLYHGPEGSRSCGGESVTRQGMEESSGCTL